MADVRELRPWRYDALAHRWAERVPEVREATVPTLTVVTFNVWFADHAFDARSEAMLRLLKEADADVIALQEVTDNFLRRALREEWLQQAYAVSDATCETVSGYGVALFSRLPVKSFALRRLPTGMGRSLLTTDIHVNRRGIRIGTVHLESLRESEPTRATQLKRIAGVLSDPENAILMGDLNFCSSWPEEANLPPEFVDVWPLLHPGEAGYTIDGSVNAMVRPHEGEKAVRFDRILVRSTPGAVKAKDIRLIGTKPISREQWTVFPSDHFGLRAELAVIAP